MKFISTLMRTRKLIALFIAIIYLILLGINGVEMLISGVIFLVFPLLLIFFSKEMATFGGFFGGFPRPMINKPSPPGLVEFMGWVLLLLPLLYAFISAFKNLPL